MPRRRIVQGIGGLGLTALLVGAVAMGPGRSLAARAQVAEPSPAAIAGPGTLEELAIRLLTPPYSGPDGLMPTIQLLPGALPPDLPFQVPVPDGGRLIGSAVRNGPGNITIVLDAPGTPAEAQRYYQQSITSQGWTAPAMPGAGPRGFQPSTGATSSIFCQGPAGPWLNLNVMGRLDGSADVRLSMDTATGGSGPCSSPDGPPQKPMSAPGMDKLPALYAPAGVNLQLAGSSGGPGRFSSDASARTDRSVAELESHFAQQLQSAGWTRADGGAQGPLAWSVWTVPGDGEWQGLLYAVDGPGAERRTFRVEVASASEQPGRYGYPIPAMPASVPPPAPGVRPSVATASVSVPAPAPTAAPSGEGP